MKQLILRIKDVDKTDYGKHGWKQKQRPEIGKGMEPTKVQDPKIIYGSGAWTPGINEINVIIDGITGNRKLNTPAKKAALKAQIEKNIKADQQKSGLVLSSGLVMIRIKQNQSLTQRFMRNTLENLLNLLDKIKNDYPKESERYFEI